MSAKQQLLNLYDLHNTLFNNVLVDVSESESEVRAAPEVNNIKWLGGHLVWGQRALAGMAGVEMDTPWLGYYDTQTKDPTPPAVPAPSLEEIKAAWNRLAGPIRQGLENFPEEALASPVEFPMPQFRTLEGLWTFISHHQAYTIGQIGIMRRVLGKDAMKYF